MLESLPEHHLAVARFLFGFLYQVKLLEALHRMTSRPPDLQHPASSTGVPGEPDQQDELIQPGLRVRGECGAAATRHHATGGAHGHQHLH